MSFTKDTFTHFWSKITGLVNSKVNQVQTDIDDIKENYATKTEVDENSVGKPGSGDYSEIFNDYTNNTTKGAYSHAEGYYTTASGYASHTEGEGTTASGSCSHAQGLSTTASGDCSHAQGQGTVANSDHQTVIGRYNIPDTPDKVGNGKYALIIGNGEEFGDDDGNPIYSNCFAVDWEGKIYVNNSENGVDLSTGLVGKFDAILEEPIGTLIGEVFNDYTNNKATGGASHAEGFHTTASGQCSHAEGDSTTASGYYSHAEGVSTTASGQCSHAEGHYTTASGQCSHAEGYYTTASSKNSHAEGYYTTASGGSSHAQGCYTKASSNYQTVMGKYNKPDTPDENGHGKYALIIGNGTSNAVRSNCFAVDWEGNIITPKGTISMDLINSIITRVALNSSSIGLNKKNLLNTLGYISTLSNNANNGTITKGIDYFTLTATSNDCFSYPTLTIQNAYEIPVKPNTKYILSWTADSDTAGKVYVFSNGVNSGTSSYWTADNKNTKQLTFTTKNDTTYITLRFGVLNSGTSITYSKIMLRYADIADSTYEPYIDDLQTQITKNDNDIAITQSSVGLKKKNLLQPASTLTRAGITYTVNTDGSISLTGKSTATTTYNYFSMPFTLGAGKYKVSGMPDGSSDSTYRVDIRANESGGTVYGYGSSEFEFELAQTTTAYYMIRIAPAYAEEFTGLTFYPMIRYADVTDSTYEPYVPSVQEQIVTINNAITDTGWVTVNLATSTSNLTFDTSISNWINYRKIGSIVYVRASMKFTSVSDENIVMTNMTEVLPDEFKPNLTGIVLGRCGTYTSSQNSDYQLMYWQFNPSGSVSIYATNNQKLSTMANKSITVNGSYFID